MGVSPLELGEARGDFSPGEQIDRLLEAEDPLVELKEVCRGIPYFFSHQEAQRLKRGGEKEKLTYRCLPTLLTSLENYSHFGVGARELFEEGFLSLQEALENWNPEKRFSTGKPDFLRNFTSRKISYSLRTLIVEKYGLRGVRNFSLIPLYRECWQEFIDQEDRPPTLEEISQLMAEKNQTGLSLEIEQGSKKISKVALMYQANQPLVPLDLVDLIGQGRTAPPPEEELNLSLLRAAIFEILGTLTPREARVLELRFGLVDGHARMLKEIGRELRLTDERIRQIETKALRKLRHPSRSKRIKDLVSY